MEHNACSEKLRWLIRQARLAKGLSQEQLGEFVMMDRNKISAIETGKKGNLVWDDLVKITAVLGISDTEMARILSGTTGEGHHTEIMNLLQAIYNIVCQIRDRLANN